ncbi:MAG TPA: acyl-CoA desaturase [Polyangiaceae bacterium]|nr:acyl-CoA desaturase [Polyangiaceae bacterium]
MLPIIVFFVVHYSLTIFCQTFYLHRYGAHRMFTMSKGVERFFHLLTAVSQGSSFLIPRPYAILHREHHAYSDTAKDPHSPHVYKGIGKMMWQTKERYEGIGRRTIQPEARFEGGYPEWPAVDRFFNGWPSRIAFGTAYTLFYMAFAPHWAYFLLLPIHYIMGPIHGAIVNYCGHMIGYRNFETPHGDKSRNTLIFDFVTWGELFQNNHHARSMSPNFASRWFEVDPTYPIIRVLAFLRIIKLAGANAARSPEPAAESPVASVPPQALPVDAPAPIAT